VNCALSINSEASSIIAARQGGTVLFFSTQIQYIQACMLLEAGNKGVSFNYGGSGLSLDNVQIILQLLEDNVLKSALESDMSNYFKL